MTPARNSAAIAHIDLPLKTVVHSSASVQGRSKLTVALCLRCLVLGVTLCLLLCALQQWSSKCNNWIGA